MSRVQLTYRTFDQLMDEVRTDFSMYELEGMIEPAQLIKVAQKVTYDLGLRIHGAHEKVIELTGGKARLPDDFKVLTSVHAVGGCCVTQEVPMGRHTEEVIVDCDTCSENPCCCDKCYTVCEGTCYKLVHKKKYTTYEYSFFSKLQIKASAFVDPICSRPGNDYSYTAEIRNGFIYVSGLTTGNLYITYLGALEDEEGNLLVLDHDAVNDYYEYAIKSRILENLYMNGEDVVQKMQLIEMKLRQARNYALGVVNTPDFKEMENIWWGNRLAHYRKYYYPFK